MWVGEGETLQSRRAKDFCLCPKRSSQRERRKCDCDAVIHWSTAARRRRRHCRSGLDADSSLRVLSFLIPPLDTSPLRHLLPIAHVLHPTGQSILVSQSWNPIFSPPRVNLTDLSACISPSSIFNTQLVLRILSYGGAPVFVRLLPWQRRGKTGGIMRAPMVLAAALIGSAASTCAAFICAPP